jgi:hypothetical protein
VQTSGDRACGQDNTSYERIRTRAIEDGALSIFVAAFVSQHCHILYLPALGDHLHCNEHLRPLLPACLAVAYCV